MIRSLPPFVLHNLIWPPVRFLLFFLARFKVEGLEHLEGMRGPVIFAGNHANEIDVVLVPAALPFLSRFSPIFYVAKKREFYEKNGLVALLYGGAFFKLWGAYPVREGLKNYRLSLNIHIDILRAGKSLLIFPEGGISPDGTIRPAHGGVAFLAKETGAPVIPVAISGTRGFTVGKLILRKASIGVTFGTPIRPEALFGGKEELSTEEYKEVGEKTMHEVRKMLVRF